MECKKPLDKANLPWWLLTITRVNPETLEKFQQTREQKQDEGKHFSLQQGALLMFMCLVVLIPAVLLGHFLVSLF